MMTSAAFPAEPPPLRLGAGSAIYVGSSRVLLDAVIEAYLHGESAEQIAEDFPTISLADVHGVLSYFLNHRTEVEHYLKLRSAEALLVERDAHQQNSDGATLRQRLQSRWAARSEG